MNYVLKISYDGTHFSGFQRQPNAVTVQGQLERALSKLFQEEVGLQAAGRTDAGVHGQGQVVGFSSSRPLPLSAVVNGSNGILGPHISVSEAALLPQGSTFHPRHSAISRTYCYYVLSECARSADTLWSSHLWCVGGTLEPTLMSLACQVLQGKHDFTTFTSRCDKPNRERDVHSLRMDPMPETPLLNGKLWRLTVTADGFLRKMVRLLVAAIVETGMGLRSPDSVKAKLLARDPSVAPHPAPASGLYFESVGYQPDPFKDPGLALQIYAAKDHLGFRFKP
jgi:tRNA pseudouridine38-40 synthase